MLKHIYKHAKTGAYFKIVRDAIITSSSEKLEAFECKLINSKNSKQIYFLITKENVFKESFSKDFELILSSDKKAKEISKMCFENNKLLTEDQWNDFNTVTYADMFRKGKALDGKEVFQLFNN